MVAPYRLQVVAHGRIAFAGATRFVAVAAVVLLAGGLAACASSPNSSTDASASRAIFVGYRWLLTTLESPTLGPSTVPLDPRDPPEISFTSDGQLGASDGVNYMTGSYSLTASGYHCDQGGGTAVGSIPQRGLRQAIIDGMDMLAAQFEPVTVKIKPGTTADTVLMTADGYTLTFRQDGRVRPEGPPSRTSSA